jgi:hypothetical protein
MFILKTTHEQAMKNVHRVHNDEATYMKQQINMLRTQVASLSANNVSASMEIDKRDAVIKTLRERGDKYKAGLDEIVKLTSPKLVATARKMGIIAAAARI